jgi:hypothetical protein
MLTERGLPALIVVVVAYLAAPVTVCGAHSLTASGARSQTPVAAVQTEVKAPAGEKAAASSVSLDRIRRMLRETPPTPPSGTSSLLKLHYYVEVVGTPPSIDFFKDFNIGKASSVQYGGMTHDEFLKITAPFWRKR